MRTRVHELISSAGPPHASAPAAPEAPSVLVIADDPVLRAAVVQALGSAHRLCSGALRGEGVARALAERPAVVVLQGDGPGSREDLSELRALDALEATPVVVTCGLLEIKNPPILSTVPVPPA